MPGVKAVSLEDADLGKVGTIELAWPLVEKVPTRESAPNGQAAQDLSNMISLLFEPETSPVTASRFLMAYSSDARRFRVIVEIKFVENDQLNPRVYVLSDLPCTLSQCKDENKRQRKFLLLVTFKC